MIPLHPHTKGCFGTGELEGIMPSMPFGRGVREMPLFWFEEDDIGDHGDLDTLIAYLDDIGRDDLADDIHYAKGENDEFSVTVMDGLEVLEEVTVPGLVWSLRSGRLVLE